ncbi:MAG: P1 family peptidase [Eubacteriales bacterium]|nr:P1 family peptidase [Eubacteriales bacterium]
MVEININEIDGFKIGNADNIKAGTGVTAIICEKGAVAGVDVRGGGPATRETDLLKPENMVEKINAVVLSGGSAYGLEAACGVMDFLENKNVGFDVGVGVVPIVCGASLFDLVVGDGKIRPVKEMGIEAAKNAYDGEFFCGNHGAGTGATIGKYLGINRMMKSGLGASALKAGKVKCGAVIAVNALGDVFNRYGKQIGGILSPDKKSLASTEELVIRDIEKEKNIFNGNTTIGCIITNGILTKAQCTKLASIAHDGYARAIKPVHTSADGDTIFVMSTCTEEVNFDSLAVMATKAVTYAIENAVSEAESAYGLIASRDL